MKHTDLVELIPRCHEASKANGWWEPRPNPAQQLMLVVSELSEALEAHRTGKEANWRGYNSERENLIASGDFETSYGRERLNIEFKSCIKDSVGDELADAYIRLCDWAGGLDLSAESVSGWARRQSPESLRAELSENFGESLLNITFYVLSARHRDSPAPIRSQAVAFALALLEAIAEQQGIDLAAHIDLKLQYNATRGLKHGGKAY